MSEPKNIPNMVDAGRVDLTRAKPSCRRCHGTGVLGRLHHEGARIPIICRCVVRNDGIDEAAPTFEDYVAATEGTADKIVGTALRLPPSMWPNCVQALDALLANIPDEERASQRAHVLLNARRVLVQRLAAQQATQVNGAAPAPIDGQPSISTDDAPACAREEEP